VFARLRARGIRPITIGRRLVEAIDAHVNEQHQVPGAYEVRLHPDDFAQLEHVFKPLVSELRQVVVNHAEYEQYDLTGEPSVGLVSADHVTPGHVVIDVARGPLGAVVVNESASVSSGSWKLVMDGTTFELAGDVATIGRQGTCTIHIPDINVSRLHAELRRSGDSWTIEDRGSTNGTKVNGDLIVRPTTLNSGDVVSLGTIQLQVERT
jgi:hypothetical protein